MISSEVFIAVIKKHGWCQGIECYCCPFHDAVRDECSGIDQEDTGMSRSATMRNRCNRLAKKLLVDKKIQELL